MAALLVAAVLVALVVRGRQETPSGASVAPEGDGAGATEEQRVGVVIGPQYGPVTAKLVEESLRAAARRGYDALVVAGFSFDAAADGVNLRPGDHRLLAGGRCHRDCAHGDP